MARSKVQVQDEIPGTSTELSEVCDTLLEARAAMETAREFLHSSEAKLVELMSADGKKTIKHGGKLIRLVHKEEKNTIQIKTAG